jgi:DHA2 family multidrug resistance protein
MLDKGKDLDWFESNTIIALTIISVVSLCYFGIWSWHQKYPIVDLSFFRNRNFTLGTIGITVGFLFYFASTVTVPLWLQTEQGYTPFWAGVAVAPVGLASMFLSNAVGKHMGSFDLRGVAALSFLLFGLSFLYQMQFTTQVDLDTIMFSRVLQGFGLTFFFLPLVTLSLSGISKARYASASGLFHFVRVLVGSGFGTSLAIELWTRLEIFHHARLTEAITVYHPSTTSFYSYLENFSTRFVPGVVNKVLDMGIEQQAYMLALNDLSLLAAVGFFALIPLIYLCQRVLPLAGAPKEAMH